MTYRIAVNKMATGKLPQGDPRWATFNDSFVNSVRDILDVANDIYTGHAYTTWHRGRRKIDNFICAQHIATDMDSGDQRSDPEALAEHPFIKAYGGLIHTTPSHQPDAPRSRVLFFLDTCITDATAYQAAASFLVAQFDGSDTACTDASRFFYGSTDCDIRLLGNELPLSHMRTYYRRWRKEQPQAAPQRPENKIVRLSDARADRITNTTYGDEKPDLYALERALFQIDPYSVDYARWIGIIAAVKRDIGEPAYALVEKRAQGKPGEVEREWARLDVNRSGGMHVNTIFHLARAQ